MNKEREFFIPKFLILGIGVFLIIIRYLYLGQHAKSVEAKIFEYILSEGIKNIF